MKNLKKLMCFVFASLMLLQSKAQQKHFIYIETEDRQPFAVVLNGKVFSSSDYGYVIIPKLADGTYNFTVSFPMNKFPDQSFKCNITKKDIGFKLENSAGKGWALQNMQTQKFLAGNGESTADNAFTDMLSDVVGDSNLAKKNLPADNVKTDTVAASAALVDTTATSFQTTAGTNVSNNATTAINANSAPQKISETKLDTGTSMVFVDKSVSADTINVFVPSNVNPAHINARTQTDTDNSNTKTSIITSDQSPQNTDTTAHNATNPFYKPNNINAPPISTVNSSGITANNALKQDCSSMVSDNDMDKIKRKMFVQHNDNDMVQTALRFLSNKCISTIQVQTLGDLFSSDDGRYNLYDALYKHVYDYGKYATLESQIIDPYYKKRFEVMLR